MGWEIAPEAFCKMLIDISQEYNLPPIYITENGAAFKDEVKADGTVEDLNRLDYLRDHLLQARIAMEQGVNLAGYFVWSLLDNFEWAFGYSKRFGIIHVDYKTQERIIKKSVHWYSSVIKNYGFASEKSELARITAATANRADRR